MRTVLGLSVTAAGVGWVLVDASAPGGRPMDDDKFAVRDSGDLIPRCLAAVRGAQAIAASSGRHITSVGVCWSADVEDRVAMLLTELRAAGVADVRSVRQVTPPPVAQDTEAPVADRADRVDPCGLLADLFAKGGSHDYDSDDYDDYDAPDEGAAIDGDVLCGSDARQMPAYDAAQAVLTDAAPAESAQVARPGRNLRDRNWNPPLPGARVATVAAAAAVTAVIALFAVGSQFVGGGGQQPGEAALAGRSSASTPQTTTPAVHADPRAAQPAAAPTSKPATEPAPEPEQATAPPVQPALPQYEPVAEPQAVIEPPVSAAPVAELPTPVPAAVPVEPVVPATAPVDQAVPLPADPAVLPPAVVGDPAAVPVPADVPPAPVQHLPAAPPVDPVQAAINSLFPPPAPAPAPVP